MDLSQDHNLHPSLAPGIALRERLQELRTQSWYEPTLRITAQIPCHIVGGCIRDLILGRTCRDIDLTVRDRGRFIAQSLAEATNSRFIQIGGERYASYRVVGKPWVVDIWDRQGQTLLQDLRRRDFTINSIACDLKSLQVVDPLAGIEDLIVRRLKVSDDDSFRTDPLRVLRLARLAAELSDAAIDPQTAALAAQSAADLSKVASQRVRTELKRSLHQISADQLLRTLALWSDLEVYPNLWIKHPDDSLDNHLEAFVEAWRREMSVLIHRLESQLARVSLALNSEVLAQGLICCSFEGIGQEKLRPILHSLRDRGLIDKRTTKDVVLALSWKQLPRTEAEKRWFLHSLGRHWPAAIHILGIRYVSRREDLSHWELLAKNLDELALSSQDLLSPSPFLTGGDVIALLGHKPGPQIKRLLAEVYRAQIEKRVLSRKEAKLLAEKLATSPIIDSLADDSAL